MEQNLMARQFDSIDREDPYSMLKQDFSNIFFKHNLDNFTNPSDIGFLNYDKTYMDSFPSHFDDHSNLLDSANPQAALRMGAQREELASYQDALLNSTYSPMGRSHHGPGHFNQNMNPNLAYNSMKQQPFQQDHPRYPGYHPQGYHYSNQYDAHAAAQHGYDGGLDYYYHHHPQDMMDNHNDDPLSLMWSDDPSKAGKMKNMPSYNQDMNAKPKMSSGYGGYEQDHNGDKYFNSYSDIKGGQMGKMHDLSRVPVKKEPESQYKETYNFGLNSGIVNHKSQAGAMKYNSRPSPERKATDPYFDDDDGEGGDYDADGKGRSTRGLRVLSLKVKEIVGQKKRTSYKEVAETLTIELRQKTGGTRSAKEDSKDEQNVKRRVYDALNVLIAAGVLRKEGKLVYCDELMTNNGVTKRVGGGNGSKDKLLADIQEARRRNKAKIEMLHELIFKFLAIKNLVKTNKEKLESEGGVAKNRTGNVNATRIDVVQENPALKPKNEDVIRFPFIVLLSSSPENSMNINMDTMQKQLAIESKKPFNIFGDIDVLLKMGLHYVTKKMFDENIPTELQRYAPKYYLAALK